MKCGVYAVLMLLSLSSSVIKPYDVVLQTTFTGVVNRKLEALPSLTYALDKESVCVVKNPTLKRCHQSLTDASVKATQQKEENKQDMHVL